MQTKHSTLRAWLSILLTILLGLSVPSTRQGKASPSAEQNREDDDGSRALPCLKIPAAASAAPGIQRLCTSKGSSAGVAKGDFNGDGVADLAIGIPTKDVVVQGPSGPVTVVNAGAVQIIYGSAANGLVAPASGSLASVLITEAVPGTNHLFGAALASGDFDGNGVSDLAVGIPGATATNTLGRGAVQVFVGRSGSGLTTTASVTFGPSNFYVAPNASPTSSHGAYSLAWGDFNGDGAGDLAVASDYSPDGYTLSVKRAVTVLFGSTGVGLTTAGKRHFETAADQPVLSGNNNVNQVVVSGGDFDGDGKTDLVAAMPLETVDGVPGAGAVHVLYGTVDGPSDCASVPVCHLQPQRWTQDSPNVPGSAGGLFTFGAAVARGDFNGDGAEDLAIGVPGSSVGTVAGAGIVIVIHGSATAGLQTTGTGPLAPLQLTAATFGQTPFNGDGFGLALAGNKFNTDGFADLAIGAPNKATERGLVMVIYGSAQSLSTTAVRAPQVLTENSFGVAAHGGDHFGASLSAWNFGKTTDADLAISAPGAPVGTVTGAGLVLVMYGSSTGLGGTPQVWSENTAGLHNSAATGDGFGSALY